MLGLLQAATRCLKLHSSPPCERLGLHTESDSATFPGTLTRTGLEAKCSGNGPMSFSAEILITDCVFLCVSVRGVVRREGERRERDVSML